MFAAQKTEANAMVIGPLAQYQKLSQHCINSHQALLIAGTFFIMFLASVLFNAFGAAPEDHAQFNSDSTRLLFGQVLQARRGQFFRSGLFLGKDGMLRESGPDVEEYVAYYESKTPSEYSFDAYQTSTGGSGWILVLLDQIGVPPWVAYRTDKMLWAVSGALLITLSAVTAWRVFGGTAASLLILSVVLSRFVVYFSPHPFWCFPVFFLPALTVWWVLRGSQRDHEVTTIVCVVVASFALKFILTGPEFLTVSAIMTSLPIVWSGLMQQVSGWCLAKRCISVVVGVAIATVLVVVIMAWQVSLCETCSAGLLEHLRDRTIARTRVFGGKAAEVYELSRSIAIVDVVMTYFKMPLLYFNQIPLLNATQICLVHAGCGFLAWAFQMGRKTKAIWQLASLSLAAPMSWLLLFSPHCVIHTHLDPIIWHMPFVPLVACSTGAIVSHLFLFRFRPVARLPLGNVTRRV